MRSISFTVDGPPPDRHDPGRCADRSSPNARSLFQAATAYVAAHHDDMPIGEPVKVSFVSASPFETRDGYDIETAIEEVLVDAGVLADERRVESERHEFRPGITGYQVRIDPA